MTTELEQQFFDTFGIEQIEYTQCNLIDCKNIYHDCNNCPFHKVYKIDYPQITDKHYLELICIHNTYLETNLYSLDYESLKNEILKDLINEQESREIKKDYVSDDMIHQVQAIFKGEE